MIVYGFDEMNYVAADIRAIEVEGAEFDPDTGEMTDSDGYLTGWYYRTFTQAKKAAVDMLKLDIHNLRETVKYVRKQKKPKVAKED